MRKDDIYLPNKPTVAIRRHGLLMNVIPECSICQTHIEGADLHYDHDHVTGEFRGFLCTHCNIGLGMFKDNPDLLAKAIAYLAPHIARVSETQALLSSDHWKELQATVALLHGGAEQDEPT